MSFRPSPSRTQSDTPQDLPLPDSCPSCKSTQIVATAKVPSATGYWRCTSCGDVWSPARTAARPTHGWRT
jgi:predicted Zn finger-like uncharacterized protein